MQSVEDASQGQAGQGTHDGNGEFCSGVGCLLGYLRNAAKDKESNVFDRYLVMNSQDAVGQFMSNDGGKGSLTLDDVSAELAAKRAPAFYAEQDFDEAAAERARGGCGASACDRAAAAERS